MGRLWAGVMFSFGDLVMMHSRHLLLNISYSRLLDLQDKVIMIDEKNGREGDLEHRVLILFNLLGKIF